MFFVFPDLGIRSPGTYRLEFSMTELDLSRSRCPILASTSTREFKVVSQKNYTGPFPPTKLAIHFVDQGADMRMR
ncbi:velvet factor [Gorgonomyces haynaldii]|nr:velvet factor [Gorgonomyces haynaldii]